MKKNNTNVPMGYNEEWFGDRDNPLIPYNIISKDADPSQFLSEPTEWLEVEAGVNPFDVIENVEVGKARIFVREDALEAARQIKGQYHFDTYALGEVFNFNAHNFANPKIAHMNVVVGFDSWKIVHAWKAGNDEEFTNIPEKPEKNIMVVMKK